VTDLASLSLAQLERIAKDPQNAVLRPILDKRIAELRSRGALKVIAGGERTGVRTDAAPPDQTAGTTAKSRFDSKTEERYWVEHIQPMLDSGALTHAVPGEWKVRLADACWYKPDVFAVTSDGGVWIIEVKGAHIRDDSLVKFKVAAEHNRWARWTMVQWKDKRWHVRYDSSDRSPHNG
jgi:hypothetical protein